MYQLILVRCRDDGKPVGEHYRATLPLEEGARFEDLKREMVIACDDLVELMKSRPVSDHGSPERR